MTTGITRESALSLLHDYVKNERMVQHCLAAEAVMRRLAKETGNDEEIWGIAGLLHDLDVELTNADPKVHGLETARILTELGLHPEIIEAIRLHNEEAVTEKRSKTMHYALAAGETITGLITATTLVYPEKKISAVKPKSVVKRMKEKAFAASVNRETIMECEQFGVPIQQFAEISIEAMQSIADEIGL